MEDGRKVAFFERNQWRYASRLLLFVMVVALTRMETAEAPETFAQALTRHHIELTRPALIEALRNADSEVRGLAAWQLVEMKATDTLPQILQAMRDEKDGRTKVNLASASAYLGSQEGIGVMEGICHDSSEHGWVRTDAARHLLDLHNRACLPDLWQLMDSGGEAGTRISAINLVEGLHDRTASESAQLLRFTLEALNAPEINLRLFAASTLAGLKDTAAIPYLRSAIQVEKEDIVRAQMETSLGRLLELKPSQ
jgi:HEAT repeat protein